VTTVAFTPPRPVMSSPLMSMVAECASSSIDVMTIVAL